MKLGRWKCVDPSQVILLLGMGSNPLELPMNVEFINACQGCRTEPSKGFRTQNSFPSFNDRLNCKLID